MEYVPEETHELDQAIENRRHVKLFRFIKSNESVTSDETLSPSPVGNKVLNLYSAAKDTKVILMARSARNSSNEHVKNDDFTMDNPTFSRSTSTETDLNLNLDIFPESPDLATAAVIPLDTERNTGPSRHSRRRFDRLSYSSIPEHATLTTHILDKDGNSHSFEVGEIFPCPDIEKARARLFDLRKASLNSQRTMSKLDRRPTARISDGIGKLKMNLVNKHRPDFSDLVLFQQIEAHEGSIWCLEFSKNGRHFASGGSDCIVRVWRVTAAVEQNPYVEEKWVPDASLANSYIRPCISETPSVLNVPQTVPYKEYVDPWEKPVFSSSRSTVSNSGPIQCTDQLFRSRPVAELVGHTGDVTSLAWTNDGRILSASLDGTVRLWRIDGNLAAYCEHIYASGHSVTCVASHPLGSPFFICGMMDGRACVWNTDTGSLAYCKKLSSIVTAVSFTEDGTTVLLGIGNGVVEVRESHKMKLKQSVDVRTKKRENNAFITGFAFRRMTKQIIVGARNNKGRVFEASEYKGPTGLALWEAQNLSRVAKFKGATVSKLPIRPSFSEDERYIISGSEDGRVYIWDSESDPYEPGYESWLVENLSSFIGPSITTNALFVPFTSVKRCIDQVNAAKHGNSDPEEEVVDIYQENVQGTASPSPMTKVLPRSSALRTNMPDILKPRSMSSEKSEEMDTPSGRISTGLNRAVAQGRMQAGAQKLRQIGAINAQNMDGEGSQPSLHCKQKDLREGPGVGNRRKTAVTDTPKIALYVEQGSRTSAGRLHGYRRMMASGGSEVPKNAMVIATDSQGCIHVYSKAAVAEEFVAAKLAGLPLIAHYEGKYRTNSM